MKFKNLFIKKSANSKEQHNEKQADFVLADVFQTAVRFHQAGDISQAQYFYKQILQYDPNHSETLHFLGILYYQTGNNQLAIELIEKAIAVNNELATAAMYSNLGSVYKTQNHFEKALDCFKKAIQLEPENANAHYNFGLVLQLTGRLDEAINHYQKTITIQPEYPEAYYNLGSLYKVKNDIEKAALFYKKTVELNPNYLEAYINWGLMLHLQAKMTEAAECFQKVLAIDPNYSDAYMHLGNIYHDLGDIEKAIAYYKKTLSFNPSETAVLQNLFYIYLQQCDWSLPYQETVQKIIQGVESNNRGHNPFSLIAVSSSASLQQQCARNYAKNYYAAQPSLWKGEIYKHNKIRIAYISADFYAHATAYLMAGLFETHNKQLFEIIAISLSRNDGSDMSKRLENAFDQFIDVCDKNDYEIALLIKNLEIDIAVDLKGYTKNARTGIFSYRPAPVQLSYLGYPGTMGAEYIDYIIADNYVIPVELQSYYVEKIVYLPDSYQVNDSKRVIDDNIPSRSAVNLPETGFVFCCFNNNYKITPVIFDIWMRLLNKVDNSVLWLLEGSPFVAANLKKEAEKRGISGTRLIFAPRMKLAQHLARQKLADLFLDTLPCNAHTTTSDALWAELPVLTCSEDSFASRVAGSLLHAIGLPELIAQNLEAYEKMAFELATHPDKLAEIKKKLITNRKNAPLFNTQRFARHIESAYMKMWEISQQGQPPVSFSVPVIDL